ncbi:hypothetical protein IGI04_040454, partial [Brassica rapa subsp. trilocularis]
RHLIEAPRAFVPLEGPPGFPLLFPELSKEDRKMAMLYISHADETERRARIQRVQQGIEENKTESSIRLTKITKELDKGKGHVFSYQELASDEILNVGIGQRSYSKLTLHEKEDGDTESSASHRSVCSEPAPPAGFRLGPSSGGRVSGTQGMSKSSRRRPSSWKRKTVAKLSTPIINPDLVPVSSSKAGSAKRKPSPLGRPVNAAIQWIVSVVVAEVS